MKWAFGLSTTIGAIVCLGLLIVAGPTYAQELTASQLVTPTQLTPEERDFYNEAGDPTVKKNFIITRSYVRLAQKVASKEIPPDSFPRRKPKGFSVQYLLPNDPRVINEPVGRALAQDMQKCLEIRALGCR